MVLSGNSFDLGHPLNGNPLEVPQNIHHVQGQRTSVYLVFQLLVLFALLAVQWGARIPSLFLDVFLHALLLILQCISSQLYVMDVVSLVFVLGHQHNYLGRIGLCWNGSPHVWKRVLD